MIYLIYMPLMLIFTVICYLTNPIVVFFADEVGELHGVLKYWQTWDDSLDVEFFVKEKMPRFLRYNFDEHYKASRMTTPELSIIGRDRGCVISKCVRWTILERIQRYFCRVGWLTRNCAYGFAFWVFGRKCRGRDIIMLINKNEGNHFIRVGYDRSRNIFTMPFIVHIEWPIIKGKLSWKCFFGWKIDRESGDNERMAMIANRIAFRLEKDKIRS
ncbi:MAG: hypothetical protein IJT82_03710 [Schwartzia sp.]|nr:hypothetical protein [Schwartzia sp. (in: firmicutes)]